MKGALLVPIGLAVGALSLVSLLVLGDAALALAPVAVCGTLYAVWRLPLRYPTLVVTFLALTLESPSDAPSAGLWKSPLASAGALFLGHLNLSLPYKWLFFSGLDLVLLYLFAVAFLRWGHRSAVDRGVPSAGPMRQAVVATLAGAAWMWIWGMARGDADVASSLWQLQRVIYVPIVFFLFLLGLRGRRDTAALGKVIVAAACIKACFAIFVRATIPPPAGEATLSYATTHPDSMLFAGAFCLVTAAVLQGVGRRRVLVAALVLPLLVAGMVANHRRVVWVELAAGLATVALLTPSTPLRRSLARGAVLASPVALVYMIVGWGSTASIFGPVEVIRSVVDSQADASTAWRDWENYNLFFTLRQSPLLGVGYGHGYIENVKLPDISQAYALYRFIPHNSILGLWAYGGLVGFTALWTVFAVGLFFAVRSARYAERGLERTAAIAAATTIVVYLVHCYGDMGLGTWTSVFTVAPAFAVASQLAVATGAWPSRLGRPRQAPDVAPSTALLAPGASAITEGVARS